MIDIDHDNETIYEIAGSPTQTETSNRIKKLLEDKHEPVDLRKVTEECSSLSKTEQSQLRILLEKYNLLFDVTLGHWPGEKTMWI